MKLLKAILLLLCVGTNLLFMYFESQLTIVSFAVAFGFYFLASAIHLFCHESGHLLGGLISGYKLLCFQLGPFCVMTNDNKRKSFSWRKTHGGQCVMYPTQVERIRYKAYNLGGVISNIFITILSLLLLFFNNFYMSLIMIELLFVGFHKIVVNLIPHKSNGVPNDGYIIKMLNKHNAMQKDYALYLKLYADIFMKKTISGNEYQYEHEKVSNEDELLYYNEIQEILKSIDVELV